MLLNAQRCCLHAECIGRQAHATQQTMGRMLCSSAPGSASWKDLAIKGLSGLLLMGGGGAGGFLIKGYLDLHKAVDDNHKRIVGRLTAIDINQATMKVEMATLKQDVTTLKQDVTTLNNNMAIMMESLSAIKQHIMAKK